MVLLPGALDILRAYHVAAHLQAKLPMGIPLDELVSILMSDRDDFKMVELGLSFFKVGSLLSSYDMDKGIKQR